jgi:hypothetical protein
LNGLFIGSGKFSFSDFIHLPEGIFNNLQEILINERFNLLGFGVHNSIKTKIKIRLIQLK